MKSTFIIKTKLLKKNISGHCSTDPDDPDYVPSKFDLPSATQSCPDHLAKKARYARSLKRRQLSKSKVDPTKQEKQLDCAHKTEHASDATDLSSIEGNFF